jgi:hypothetical protein
MPSLVSPNLKVQRAKEHLDSLNRAIKAFRQSKPYRISTHDDLESRQWVIRMEMDEPPLLLGLIAGDFICCLRSSLDYLAWQLAGLTISAPSRNTSFPICGKDSAETRKFIDKATEEIPPEAAAVMKSFQPYHCGDDYKGTPLWRLNKLWNIDKHCHIPFHSAFVEIYFPRIP